jgi:hypothetical protein
MPDDGDSELLWVPLAALVGGARVFPDPHVHAQPMAWSKGSLS